MKTKFIISAGGLMVLLSVYSQVDSSNSAAVYTQGIPVNMRQDSLLVSQELLAKYCGNYVPDEEDIQLGPMSIITKGNNIYRHLDGDRDRLLIATSNKSFAYADSSGRTLEFIFNRRGKVSNVILSRPDGEFMLKKVK